MKFGNINTNIDPIKIPEMDMSFLNDITTLDDVLTFLKESDSENSKKQRIQNRVNWILGFLSILLTAWGIYLTYKGMNLSNENENLNSEIANLKSEIDLHKLQIKSVTNELDSLRIQK